MHHLFQSNRAERLIERLIVQLEVERQLPDFGPFTPSVLLVPDERVAAYLKLQIARHTGVMANMVMLEFADFIDHIATPSAPPLLNARRLRARLIELFRDPDLLQPAHMAPVRRYLSALDDQPDDADAQARRTFQLAHQLGALFEDYAYARPQLLEDWCGETRWFAQTLAANTEQWQQALWHHLTQRFDDQPLLTPRQLAASIRAGEHHSPPMVLHLFGFNGFSPAMYEVFSALSQKALVFGYAINPAIEYWAEIPFGRPEDEEQLFSSADVFGGRVEYAGDDSFWATGEAPFLLRAWGFAGAQHLRATDTVAQTELQELFDDPLDGYTPTLLRRMQSDLLHMRSPATPEEGGELDRSIRVLAAPSIKREVEAIASQIVDLLEDPHTDIAPHQIAVMLPERHRDIYQTHIRAVFPTTQRIPFNMVDMPALRWSRAIEAVRMMLELPFGQFRRQELLRLLTHPNLIERFPHIDPRDWIQWCDELRILHGADRRDHADTYIEHELFHWDQGLKRLTLGAMMTGRPSDDRRAFEVEGQHYLPYEYGMEHMPSAARLVLMARSLIEDARFCREAHMTMAEWADFFCKMVSTYLVPAEPGDQMLLHRCRQRFAGMADDEPRRREVPFRMAYETALDLLRELEVRQGQPLLQGVTVMGLEARRAIPFEVVFVAGLGEGEFPESEPRRPEDLRGATDKQGAIINAPGALPDVALRDRQKQMFLETFLHTRQRFILSYVARDVRTGESRAPSAVVSELLYTIEQDYTPFLPGESEEERAERVRARVVERHEQRRFHARYFPDILTKTSGARLTPSKQPEARREASAKALRHHLAAHCDTHEITYPLPEELIEALPPERVASLDAKLTIHRPPAQTLDEEYAEGEPLRLTTFDIRSFLECPLQGSARFLLRLDDDDDEDLYAKESEIFETSGIARMTLLRDVFMEKLGREHQERRPLDFDDIYDVRARYFELEGLVPTGPFYRAARQRHLKLLQLWQENLTRLGLGRSPKMEVRRFGRLREHEFVDVASRPFTLNVDLGLDAPVPVEISGRTEVVLPHVGASLIPHTTENAYYLSPKYFMRGFLDHVLLAARGEEQGRTWRVLVNPGEEVMSYKRKNCERSFEPVPPDKARNFLRTVIQDMLTQVHAYYLPIEVAFDHIKQNSPVSEIAERKKRDYWNKTASDFGPVRHARSFDLPDDPEGIIRRRYGLFFDHLAKGGRR